MDASKARYVAAYTEDLEKKMLHELVGGESPDLAPRTRGRRARIATGGVFVDSDG
jgi:hypothetical protein